MDHSESARRRVLAPQLVLMRSLFPIVALGILLGSLLYGPWVALVLVIVWWNIVTRIA